MSTYHNIWRWCWRCALVKPDVVVMKRKFDETVDVSVQCPRCCDNHGCRIVSESMSMYNGIAETRVPVCSLPSVELRFLQPSDLEEVRELCQDWFPVDYPQAWYEAITSSSRFYSLAAVYQGSIIGLIVAEIKPFMKINKEDRDILSSPMNPKHSEAGYILSLGVREPHRRQGVASLLLENLINHLQTAEHRHCRAIFLHVLTTNHAAIRFYEHRNFKLQSFLPYYYLIKGRCKDGFTYVLYINGGHPPWGPCDYLIHYCKALCNSQPFTWSWTKLTSLAEWFVPSLRSASTANLSQLD